MALFIGGDLPLHGLRGLCARHWMAFLGKVLMQ